MLFSLHGRQAGAAVMQICHQVKWICQSAPSWQHQIICQLISTMVCKLFEWLYNKLLSRVGCCGQTLYVGIRVPSRHPFNTLWVMATSVMPGQSCSRLHVHCCVCGTELAWLLRLYFCYAHAPQNVTLLGSNARTWTASHVFTCMVLVWVELDLVVSLLFNHGAHM